MRLAYRRKKRWHEGGTEKAARWWDLSRAQQERPSSVSVRSITVPMLRVSSRLTVPALSTPLPCASAPFSAVCSTMSLPGPRRRRGKETNVGMVWFACVGRVQMLHSDAFLLVSRAPSLGTARSFPGQRTLTGDTRCCIPWKQVWRERASFGFGG